VAPRELLSGPRLRNPGPATTVAAGIFKLVAIVIYTALFMSSKRAKFHPTNRGYVYYSQARRQDFAAGGAENHKGSTFLKHNIGCMQQPLRKKSLATCKLYSHLTRPKSCTDMNAEPAERRHLLFCILGKRRDRKCIFCKSLKLLSPCRLFSRFTFAPRLLFHVVQATAHQAVRCAAEIKQTDDTTWQLRHKSRNNVIF